MSAAFTPGPWRLWCDEQNGAFEITAALKNGVSGALVVVQRGGMPTRLEMAKANARLIAAAPDLLAAAEAQERLWEFVGDDAREEIKRVQELRRAAILKARGEAL